ncbi:YicC family protein [Bermanella marisrubri]|nr:YicC family protein [Bermanella marisrubri]
MTGFARQDLETPLGHYSVEIRSVNSRYLEPHFRLPDSMRALEPKLRERLKNVFSRGKLEVSIKFRADMSQQGVSLNEALVERINQAADQVHGIIGPGNALDALEILKWPGVLNEAQLDKAQIEEQTLQCFDEAIKSLLDMSQREGDALNQFLTQRIEGIQLQVDEVRRLMPQLIQAQREHLQKKLADLQVNVEPERLEQEMMIVLQKTDVDEELDRLEAHVKEVSHIMEQSGPVGRRLDFMMQELNREANTLSSKSMSSLTTNIAVELKVLIEQMREQVQNIE